MEPLFVCLLVYFNASCFLTGWCQEEILLLCIIQDPLGEKGDASLAPLQCFGTANHGQRQNESVLLYQLPPVTVGKASGVASKSVLACIVPAKCPLCNPLAHGRRHLTVIKTPSLCLHRGRTLGWGTLLNDSFCPSCTRSPVFSSSSKNWEQQWCVLQPHRVWGEVTRFSYK